MLERSFLSVFSFLYLVIGFVFIIILIQSSFTLFHVGFLGGLNMIAFYGMLKKERWAIFLATWVSLLGVVFGYTVILAALQLPSLGLFEMILVPAMIVYTTFSIISILYLLTLRNKFIKIG